jgi:hypothetical protein
VTIVEEQSRPSGRNRCCTDRQGTLRKRCRPAGGEVWQTGTTQDIKWVVSSQGAGLESIRIEVQVWNHIYELKNVFTITPATHLPGDAVSFRWEIPASLGAGRFRRMMETDHHYYLKVIARDTLGREGEGMSNGSFGSEISYPTFGLSDDCLLVAWITINS